MRDKLDERLDGRRDGDRLRLRRAATTHRHDDHAAARGSEARDVPGDGRLADALPGAEDGERPAGKGLEQRRVEPEVRADVREPGREHRAREPETLHRPEHRLVGEVDDEVRAKQADRLLDAAHDPDSVVLAPAELLGPADEHRADDLVRKLCDRVTDDGCVVLAVDECERTDSLRASPHVRVVTSSSMAPVNFAYSSVSSENVTSLTCPWKGWRREMFTCRSATSMTL